MREMHGEPATMTRSGPQRVNSFRAFVCVSAPEWDVGPGTGAFEGAAEGAELGVKDSQRGQALRRRRESDCRPG